MESAPLFDAASARSGAIAAPGARRQTGRSTSKLLGKVLSTGHIAFSDSLSMSPAFLIANCPVCAHLPICRGMPRLLGKERVSALRGRADATALSAALAEAFVAPRGREPPAFPEALGSPSSPGDVGQHGLTPPAWRSAQPHQPRKRPSDPYDDVAEARSMQGFLCPCC